MSEAKKYLDQAGVDAFWSKVKAKVGEKKEIADVNGLQSALDAKADQETTYTKEEVDAAIKAKVEALGAVLSFKGVKATKAELPTKASNPVKGDVWHVTENSAEYVWDGTNWEELGTTVNLDGYLTNADLAGYLKTADADTKYATAAQGALADTALQPADIAAIDVDYINGLS